jgi:sugar phosphate isomerase/epimerase
MLREIRELGFEYAELSHGTRISLLEGIYKAVDEGEIKISSLHNFCPLPLGIERAAPNIFKFTALSAQERDLAWRHTLRTLDTAVRVKAPLVVLHMGSVEMRDYTDKLIVLAEDGLVGSPKYDRLSMEVLEKREARKEEHLKVAYDLLHRLAPEAEKRGLRLGIENREAVEEIPFETDFMFFFKEFSSPAVAYWHDTGHAQIKENLGFLHHLLHLDSLSSRLAGFHLHDVEFPARDHRPPGKGTVDFAALKPMVKPEHIKVFEFSPRLAREEALEGVAHLKKIWGEE